MLEDGTVKVLTNARALLTIDNVITDFKEVFLLGELGDNIVVVGQSSGYMGGIYVSCSLKVGR